MNHDESNSSDNEEVAATKKLLAKKVPPVKVMRKRVVLHERVQRLSALRQNQMNKYLKGTHSLT